MCSVEALRDRMRPAVRWEVTLSLRVFVEEVWHTVRLSANGLVQPLVLCDSSGVETSWWLLCVCVSVCVCVCQLVWCHLLSPPSSPPEAVIHCAVCHAISEQHLEAAVVTIMSRERTFFQDPVGNLWALLCSMLFYIFAFLSSRASLYIPNDSSESSLMHVALLSNLTLPKHVTGFVRSWKTWKCHGILKRSFPGLEKSWKKLKS